MTIRIDRRRGFVYHCSRCRNTHTAIDMDHYYLESTPPSWTTITVIQATEDSFSRSEHLLCSPCAKALIRKELVTKSGEG